MQALEQQIKDKKQQEDYERKRADAFGKYLYIIQEIDLIYNFI